MDRDSTLPRDAFRRADETPDEQFYRQPRFVTHIDAGAIAAVTGLYREYFPAGGRILDLMSSWVSHLPPEVPYAEVTGLGLNRAELERNPRLTSWVVQNLNTSPRLPFEDHTYDAAGITVSVDYLTDPVAVLRDLSRVLVPGGPVVISFSNRCFPTKAVAVWHTLDDAGHLQLVRQYLQRAGNWTDMVALDRSPRSARGALTGDPLYAVVGRAQG
ncbi:class I SAM-dependent methyltransferase [Deinococcus radiopugnans]|uniref:Methyltransferase domain-containing protein n=1 Tax=Deinococcus radiopugnans ATCC 19172 TaxID=585398 RepID=A0A5C4YC10_9DEIO|nr:methyltransferase domain-containing protein [Deinococcus radiopugnans]MBB6015176.1 SAM-dependent methyltransferase [Deinococcus radiopugnans ATCC 19172]TNM73116.1 methyltransferase domain-containing protein [Deinococcus radiopugnans ATCC 19172]